MVKKVFFVFLLSALFLYSLPAEPVSFVAPISGEFTTKDDSALLYVYIETGDKLLVFYFPDGLFNLYIEIKDSLGITRQEGELSGGSGAYFSKSGFYKVTISPVETSGRWACAIINKTEYESVGFEFTEGGVE